MARGTKILIGLGWLFFCVVLFHVHLQDVTFYLHFRKHNFKVPKNSQSEIGCVIPKVDPFDPFVLQFIRKLNLTCNRGPLFTYLDTHDKLLKTPEAKNFICYYTWVSRMSSDDQMAYSEREEITEEGVQMTDSLFVANVSCYNEEKEIYRNIHLKIPSYDVPINSEKPKVFILVIESLGHLSYQRHMPKTREVLRKIGNFHTFSAVNRVEENSFPNSMAMIAGQAITDAVASKETGIKWDNKLPYIWSDFKRNNYITAFLEDNPMLGLFSYYDRGFYEPPTDFYPVQFWSHMFPDYESKVSDILKNFTYYCYENVGPKVDIYLDICARFAQKYHNRPYFMYAFYSQMTHEDFNNFQLVDEPIANFLNGFDDLFASDTVFILMGDHGIRQGPYVDSPMGRMEGSLPFFSIRIPNNLNHNYPHLRKYLSLNQDRLTTWFDVHKTLLDIAKEHFEPLELDYPIPVAYSIIRQEIPVARTCRMAEIPSMFCTCNGKVGVNLEFKNHHVRATKEAVENLKQNLRKMGLCKDQKLHYYRTLKASYVYPKESEKWHLNERIKATVIVKPSLTTLDFVASRSRKSINDVWGDWTIDDDELFETTKAQTLAHRICSRRAHDVWEMDRTDPDQNSN